MIPGFVRLIKSFSTAGLPNSGADVGAA